MLFGWIVYGIKSRQDTTRLALPGHTSPTLIPWEIVTAGWQNGLEKTNVFLLPSALFLKISLSTANRLTLRTTAALNPTPTITILKMARADIFTRAIPLP